MKFHNLTFLILTVLLSCSLLTTPSVNNLNAEEVAIEVNGETVSESELESRIDQTVEQLKQQYADQISDDDDEQQFLEQQAKQQVVDQTVQQLVLKTSAQQANDIEVTDNEIETQIDMAREGFKSEDEFRAALQHEGLSPDDFKERIHDSLLIEKFIQQEIGDIQVSEEEARDYFENNQQNFPDSSFEEAESEVKRLLRHQKKQQEQQEMISELREESDIEVNI